MTPLLPVSPRLDGDLLARRCTSSSGRRGPSSPGSRRPARRPGASRSRPRPRPCGSAPCSRARCRPGSGRRRAFGLVADPRVRPPGSRVPHGVGVTPGAATSGGRRPPHAPSASGRSRRSATGTNRAAVRLTDRLVPCVIPSWLVPRVRRVPVTGAVIGWSRGLARPAGGRAPPRSGRRGRAFTESRLRASHSQHRHSSATPSASRTSSRSNRGVASNRLTATRNGHAVLLEVVDRREAVLDAAGVEQDDRAQRALDEVVPEERVAVLPGRAEQVQPQRLVEADPAEVERDRGASPCRAPGRGRRRRPTPRSCRPR